MSTPTKLTLRHIAKAEVQFRNWNTLEGVHAKLYLGEDDWRDYHTIENNALETDLWCTALELLRKAKKTMQERLKECAEGFEKSLVDDTDDPIDRREDQLYFDSTTIDGFTVELIVDALHEFTIERK